MHLLASKNLYVYLDVYFSLFIWDHLYIYIYYDVSVRGIRYNYIIKDVLAVSHDGNDKKNDKLHTLDNLEGLCNEHLILPCQ